jgi:carboxyl-terminal processing protease
VAEVPPGSPAQRAGLQPDDRIVAIDGKPVAGLSSQQVHQLLSGEVGSTVVLQIERAGRREELRVERAPYETRRLP